MTMVARLALPPTDFNASLVLQTDVKATGHCPTLIPKDTTSAGLVPPEQSKAWGFSVAVHVSDVSPQTSFEENKAVIKQICY